MAAKLTRLTHKVAMKLHVVTETCTICSSRSRRPVRKLLDTPIIYTRFRFADLGKAGSNGMTHACSAVSFQACPTGFVNISGLNNEVSVLIYEHNPKGTASANFIRVITLQHMDLLLRYQYWAECCSYILELYSAGTRVKFLTDLMVFPHSVWVNIGIVPSNRPRSPPSESPDHRFSSSSPLIRSCIIPVVETVSLCNLTLSQCFSAKH
jgi:hypothetical protein